MRTLKTAISLIVLGWVLVSGAQASERGNSAGDANSATPATPSKSRVPAALADAEAARPDSTVNNPKRVPDKPEHSDRPGRKSSQAVRKAAEEVVQDRIDSLKQQDLKKALHAAIEAERDQIRAKLKENRPAFLTPPQDGRQNLAELKEKLREHKEVLEAAQSEAKDKARKRKDGDP